MRAARSGGLLIAGLAGALAVTASVPQAQAADKTTEVFVFNHSACSLTSRAFTMASGKVTRQSAEQTVAPKGVSAWASGPSRWGNIEGTATFQTAQCANSTDNGRAIKVTWKNPKASTNSYNSKGTDSRFRVTHTGGSGVSATVYFTVVNAS
jgi:hypothetical protein